MEVLGWFFSILGTLRFSAFSFYENKTIWFELAKVRNEPHCKLTMRFIFYALTLINDSVEKFADLQYEVI